MKLNKLHIHKFSARPKCQSHSVTSICMGICRIMKHPAIPAGSKHHRLCPHPVEFSAHKINGNKAPYDAFFNDKANDLPLFVYHHSTLHQLFIKKMKYGMSRPVCCITCPWMRGASEGSLRNPSIFIARKIGSHSFQLIYITRRLRAHYLYRLLIAKIVTPLHSIKGMTLG